MSRYDLIDNFFYSNNLLSIKYKLNFSNQENNVLRKKKKIQLIFLK